MGRTTAAHFFIPSDPNALPDILEVSAGSTGNVAPTRTISGSATTMSAVGDLALDSAGNIYVLKDLNLFEVRAKRDGERCTNGDDHVGYDVF
jgi:hypothetical protein